MKRQKENTPHFVIEKLINIMNDRKLTKSAFADLVGFPEAKWNKISNGNQSLDIVELSKIAEKLRMREIDIYTYPKIFGESDNVQNDIRAQLTIELKEELKQRVLKLIFGNENIQVLNK